MPNGQFSWAQAAKATASSSLVSLITSFALHPSESKSEGLNMAAFEKSRRLFSQAWKSQPVDWRPVSLPVVRSDLHSKLGCISTATWWICVHLVCTDSVGSILRGQ